MISPPPYLGDVRPNGVIYYYFNTFNYSTGAPATLAGGAPLVLGEGYNGDHAVAGTFTLAADVGGVVGLNRFTLDTSGAGDAALFATSIETVGTIYSVRLAAGATVGGVSVGNRELASFSYSHNGPYVDAGGRVTVGPAGLDPVQADALNARQVLALLAAAVGGNVSGAGTGAITVAAANSPNTPRVAAAVDSYGNRRAVTLSPPA